MNVTVFILFVDLMASSTGDSCYMSFSLRNHAHCGPFQDHASSSLATPLPTLTFVLRSARSPAATPRRPLAPGAGPRRSGAVFAGPSVETGDPTHTRGGRERRARAEGGAGRRSGVPYIGRHDK